MVYSTGDIFLVVLQLIDRVQLISVSASTGRCDRAGGRCVYTYTGDCDGGHFYHDMCPGPAYWRCCVKPADRNVIGKSG